MELLGIKVTGIRENDAETKKVLQEKIKVSDLIQSPYELFEEHYSKNDYEELLLKNDIENMEFLKNKNYTTQNLLSAMKIGTEKIITLARNNVDFTAELGSIQTSRFLKNFERLERHTFSLSGLDKDDFELVAKEYKNNLQTNSPFAFLNIDAKNRLLHITESIKTITKYEEAIIFDKRPRSFFSSQGSRYSDRVSNGLSHTSDYKHFNFNMNYEARSLYKCIHKVLSKNENDLAIYFQFGDDEQKPYMKSNIFKLELDVSEVKALDLIEEMKKQSAKKHSSRQGSIAPSKIDEAVEKREIKQIEPSALEVLSKNLNTSKLEIISTSTHINFGKIKDKFVLLNAQNEVISDSYSEMREPITQKFKEGNVSYILALKGIDNNQYYGMIGFDGKEIIPFMHTEEIGANKALEKKVKAFYQKDETQEKEVKQESKQDNEAAAEEPKETANKIVEKITEQPKKELSTLDKYLKIIEESKEKSHSAMQAILIGKIQDVFENKEKYTQEFYDLLKKGNGIDFVVDRLKERYNNQPFVFELISNEIKIDIESTKDKDQIIKLLDAEIKTYKTDLKDANKNIVEKEDRIGTLSTELESEVTKHEKTIENFSETLSKIEKDREDREEKFVVLAKSKEEEIQALLGKALQMKKDNESLVALNKEKEDRIGTLSTELESEVTKHEKTIENFSETLSKIEKDREDREEKLELKIEKLEEQNTSVIRESGKERDKYTTLIEKTNQENTDTMNKFTKLIDRNSTLEEKIQHLEEEKNALLEELKNDNDKDEEGQWLR